MGGVAVSGVASVVASWAATRAQPEREPAAGGSRWQGLHAEQGGGGRRQHLLELLAVRGDGVSLQGLCSVSLRLAEKLVARGCLNAVAPGPLVHIIDQLTGRRFLIDTGASYSIFSHHSTSPPSGLLLTGPAASGYRAGARGRFSWTFMAAGLSGRSFWRTSHSPLLGSTFCVAAS
jgi:hypothetical protein